jgi:adenine-specific DNA-methyltransferase
MQKEKILMPGGFTFLLEVFVPTLNWLGKDAVLNHHLDVLYRTLELKESFNCESGKSENKIIHGDNLEALKALLPEYEGRVKCIYIDPPYNTGNENWVYNDNVNSPKIRKWLGQVVGKESEDLTRHDKWLCMMYPRLKLLQKLLSEDGAIFISIDDNEQANLKLICDEIFGAGNFVANFLWKSTPGSNTGKDIKVVTEYILMYKKQAFVANTKLQEDTSKYNLEDEFVKRRGKYVLNKLDRRMTGNHYSEALNYQIETPDKTLLYPGSSLEKQTHWNWRWSKSKVEWGVKNGFIVFKQNKGIWSVYFKQYQYVNNDDEIIERSLPYQNFLDGDSFNSARGTADLMKIFESKKFDYPKPISLIEEILKIATDKSSIILDSFAGSGTTAHAVLNLNKQDGGNRKFILVEMEDYANTITAERVRRVINGYASTEGTGGDFNFYELGPEMILDGNLNEHQSVEKICSYIYYTETGTPIDKEKVKESKHEFFLGDFDNTAYYLFYKKKEITTLDFDFLSTIQIPSERYVIYADNCVLPKDFLFEHNITFKKIPRDVRKF